MILTHLAPDRCTCGHHRAQHDAGRCLARVGRPRQQCACREVSPAERPVVSVAGWDVGGA